MGSPGRMDGTGVNKTAAPPTDGPAWIRVDARVAAELLKHFELSDDAAPLAQGAAAPAAFLRILTDANCYHDAVKFLAHGLPKREAVWWACLAVRDSLAGERDPNQIAAIEAAERWATQPTVDHCRIARQIAEKTAFKSAASWAATAAWWSAGSMAAIGQPEVPPPPFLYAQAVASAICLAAVMPDPLNAAQHYQRYLAIGIDLACGGTGVL